MPEVNNFTLTAGSKITAGVLGVSGYTGGMLYRLLRKHPNIGEIVPFGFSSAGKSLRDVLSLPDVPADAVIRNFNEDDTEVDVFFLALPHSASYEYIERILQRSKLVIDLSADYRLDTVEDYLEHYAHKHEYPELLKQKFYGYADLTKQNDYAGKKLIAVPGCYPTISALSNAPVLEKFAGKIASVDIIASSGISGAGKSLKESNLFVEVYGNYYTYNIKKHRHSAEINRFIRKNNPGADINFIPNIMPVSQGMYATVIIRFKDGVPNEDWQQVYTEYYTGRPFIKILTEPPKLTMAVNNNDCYIYPLQKENVLTVSAAIDNLVKGASGQGVQHFNIISGIQETTGLV